MFHFTIEFSILVNSKTTELFLLKFSNWFNFGDSTWNVYKRDIKKVTLFLRDGQWFWYNQILNFQTIIYAYPLNLFYFSVYMQYNRDISIIWTFNIQ